MLTSAYIIYYHPSLSLFTEGELVAMLDFGAWNALSKLEDGRNSVSVHLTAGHMKMQDTECNFTVPGSKITVVATMAAAHPAYYLPFRWPRETLIEWYTGKP